MIMNEFTYPSSDGIHGIHAYECIPEGQVKAVIQVCHGISEHFLRYKELFDYMSDLGILVCGNDYLGHGKTASVNDFGFVAEKNGWDYLCRDIASLTEIMKEKHPNVRYILLGHSMGSFTARTVMMKGMIDADGYIFSGTGQQNCLTVTAGKAISKLIMTCSKNKKVRSNLIQKLAFGAYNKKTEKSTPNDWISSIPEQVGAYNSDKLCGKQMTVSLFYDMLTGLDFIRKQKNYALSDKKPILMISGWDDPVGAYGKGVEKAYKAMKKAGIDVKNNMYQGRHELLHDVSRDKVLADIYAFVSAPSS